jgi:hypothetical protein
MNKLAKLYRAALIAGLLVVAFSVLFLTGCKKSPQAWEVVCDDHGHFSYADDFGEFHHIYDSWEQAARERDEHNYNFDRYIAEKKRTEAVKWHACPLDHIPGHNHGLQIIPPGGSIEIIIPAPTPKPKGKSS